MKKIYQEKIDSELGDCHAACLASVLETTLDEIPQFHGTRWWFLYKLWLTEKYNIHSCLSNEPSDDYCIAFIKSGLSSDRYIVHSVIYYKDKVIHDPTPPKYKICVDKRPVLGYNILDRHKKRRLKIKKTDLRMLYYGKGVTKLIEK